jgi:dihydroorotate dehydrogenase electron transfer subunit
MKGRNGHVDPFLTTPAPRAVRTPVQREVEVADSRPVDAYVELTLRAPEIAERAQPGQFVAFAVGGPTSAHLLRRSIAISTARDGIVGVVLSDAGPGSRWLTERRPGDRLDVVGPLGRPFPLPAPGTRALLVGGGYGAAALLGLAEVLRERGTAIDVVAGAAVAGRLCSVQQLTRLADRLDVTTDDGSSGRRGLVTLAAADFLGRAGGDRAGIVYACGPMPMLRAVAAAAGERGIPSYVAVEEAMACGVGVCMTCVLPVVGDDGRTRFARSCTDGPVFGGDRVRFADVGRLPADLVGADAMGVLSA